MTEFEIIAGNICSIGAMLSDSYSGTRKNEKGILLAQCVSQIFYGAGSLLLKGYSATVQNAVTIFRNTYAVYGKHNKYIEWFFVGLPVVLGFVFNNRGLLGVLPIAANLQYSLTMVLSRNDPRKLRWSLLAVCLMFSVFNFAILNFVSGVSCIFTAAVTFVSLLKDRKKDKAEKVDAE